MMHGRELWRAGFWKSLPVFAGVCASLAAALSFAVPHLEPTARNGKHIFVFSTTPKVWEQNSPSPEPPPLSAPEKQLPCSADLNSMKQQGLSAGNVSNPHFTESLVLKNLAFVFGHHWTPQT